MTIRNAAAPLCVALLASACGGSGTGSGTPGGNPPVIRPGIPLPHAVVAVPAKSASAGGQGSALIEAGGPPADSDYAIQPTVKTVAEPALRQLEFLNSVLDALSVAHHDDVAVVNQGPYSILVPWIDTGGGRPTKRLARWAVVSRMMRFDDRDVNRVQLWPSHALPGDLEIPRVQVDIREPPRRNPDGSYADYGAWSLIASFSDIAPPGFSYFAATAARDATGASVVKFDYQASNPDNARKGVLVTSGTGGAGWFVSPEGGLCTMSGEVVTCTPRTFEETVYAYDAQTLTIRKGANPPISRERAGVVDVVTRLGAFDAVTGVEAGKTDPYLLPVVRTGSDPGRRGFAYADGVYLEPGVLPGEALVAVDALAGEAPREFTVSRVFTGNFFRTEFVPLALADIRDNVGIVYRCSPGDPGACESEYLVFDGARWLRKVVVRDSATDDGLVAFDGVGYEPFDFAVGTTQRLSTAWMRYDVTRVDEATYEVRRIVETLAHPSNAAAFVPEGVVLTSGVEGATYRFDGDPASPTFLQLVIASGADAGARVTSDTVVGSDLRSAGTPYYLWRPDGTTHYLMEGGEYARFGDPLCFAPVRLRTVTGEERGYLLQAMGTFAEIPGWNFTLPHLAASGGVMSREIARYVVNVPAGTEVVEYGGARRRFLLKPLEVDQYLLPSALTLELAAAAALRTTPLPPYAAFTPPMGRMPTLAEAPLRYSEGRPLERAAAATSH